MGDMFETVKSLAAAVNEFWPMVAGLPMIGDCLKTFRYEKTTSATKSVSK